MIDQKPPCFATSPELTQPVIGKSKNRPNWAIPQGHGPKHATFKCVQSRYGDGNPNRRQCVATARSGERCRQGACQGASTCRVHGGVGNAARAQGMSVTQATMRRPRRALAAIGSGELPHGFPLDVPLPLSPIDRGALFEAWQNRALAPHAWQLALTATRNHDARKGRE